MKNSSTPSFSEFEPVIPYQETVIYDLYNFDYSLGTHEILLSGSVGSAKSLLMAHVAIRHCIENTGARILLGRKALPDLKDTIYTKIKEHLEGTFKEGRDYWCIDNNAKIKFKNGSQILSRSWSDKKYKKMGSLELSGAILEELSENNEEDKQAYDYIKMRVGRLPHIKHPFIMSASNPDSPSHWIYKYFQLDLPKPKEKTKHVYYSVTTDNPFLPTQYIEQLRNDLDPKLAQRMIYGKWIEIAGEVIYYAYDKSINFRNYDYQINKSLPIILSWDFNIGEGKPMSMLVGQYLADSDKFHFFDEVVIDGARTSGTIEELDGKGLLSTEYHYVICGDAAGKNRDTRSSRSDYDIILSELNKRNLKYEYYVPAANPPIRTRHNRVNSYCRNDLGISRLFLYRNCETVDEGLRMTKLKKGASYLEDDSFRAQHVTTALGYAIVFIINQKDRGKQRTHQL